MVEQDYYTTRELADVAGVQITAIRDAIYRGVIDATKRGRDWLIPASEAQAYLERRRQRLGK